MSKAHLNHKLIYGDDEELVIATLEDLRETLHIMQNITGMSLHSFCSCNASIFFSFTQPNHFFLTVIRYRFL